VQVLARIVAWPLGLLSLGAGLFGLLMSHGLGLDLSGQARRQLQALVGWGVEQGWALPIDLATKMEQALAGTLPGLVLLPVGLAALFWIVLHRINRRLAWFRIGELIFWDAIALILITLAWLRWF